MPTKRLLFVAFHVPPFQGSTGVTRTLSFAKYLREYDWEVTLLTATASAYSEVRRENLAQIPSHVRVMRALALDAQRHFSLFGRYPLWLGSPDRWRTWYWPAIWRGMALIKRWRPNAIMSTYPIATAQQIGFALAKSSGLPWIADLRDPMAQIDYPVDPRIHAAFESIERAIFSRAARVIVTTSGTANLYAERFPSYERERIILIPNGYDAELFPTKTSAISRMPDPGLPLKLLHSGLLYPVERDPTAFFQAVSELQKEGKLTPRHAQFIFRAPGNETSYVTQLQALGIAELVQLLPAVPYREALAEMNSADAFMLFQASNCNDQIPAKLYEYLYVQKPILGLTDPRGETARLMTQVGAKQIANLHDKESIKRALPSFLEKVRMGDVPTPPIDRIAQFSRRNLTGELARLLDTVVSEQGVANKM